MLDYSGIAFLIMGSTYPPTFYPLACEPYHKVRNIFILISTVSNVTMFLLLQIPYLTSPQCRAFRALGFIVLGIAAAVPMMYMSFEPPNPYIGYFDIWTYWIGGFMYIGGALLYMLRIPERFKKRTFDYIGSSHQIFHVCVVTGAFWHF